jgi:4-hydroxy-tetrahydrodipicolinate synthase
VIPAVEDRLVGAYPTVPTPFQGDLSLDLDSLGAMVDRLLGRGIRGLTILGSISEAAQLTDAEQCAVLGFVVKRAAGRATIVAGVMQIGTAAAVEQGKRFRDLGAHALLLAAPEYQDAPLIQAIEHFTAVVRDVNLPTLYHDTRRPSELALTVEDVGELFNAVSLVGMRSVDPDPSEVGLQIRAIGRPTAMFSGQSFNCLSCLNEGAVGAMCPIATVMPVTAARVVAEHRAANDGAAMEAQARLSLAAPLLAADLADHAGVKEALVAAGILKSAAVRGPLPAVSAERRRQIRELAKTLVEL